MIKLGFNCVAKYFWRIVRRVEFRRLDVIDVNVVFPIFDGVRLIAALLAVLDAIGGGCIFNLKKHDYRN